MGGVCVRWFTEAEEHWRCDFYPACCGAAAAADCDSSYMWKAGAAGAECVARGEEPSGVGCRENSDIIESGMVT